MKNFKRILVPTDFSPNAEKALNYAVQLAKKSEGEIYLIHSVESGMTDTEAANAPDKLDILTKSIRETEKVKSTNKIYTGITLYAILDSISEFKIDLVVMGTLGNAKASKKIFGSRTASVIGKSPVPVLAIPLMSEWKKPKKILLAVKNFDESESRIHPVINMASLFGAGIQVAIFTDTDDDYVEDYAENEKKITKYRDHLKKQFKNVEINAVHLAGEKFIDNVKNWIDTNQIDMLVMLTHKKNIFEKFFIGSKTKKMSYYVDIPLLAIPV
jgi:nucleotide-binding universal stress UspA family protein